MLSLSRNNIVLYALGSALVKCGQTQQKLGQAEQDFLRSAAHDFLQPLKGFLEGDMKTVQVQMLCKCCVFY